MEHINGTNEWIKRDEQRPEKASALRWVIVFSFHLRCLQCHARGENFSLMPRLVVVFRIALKSDEWSSPSLEVFFNYENDFALSSGRMSSARGRKESKWFVVWFRGWNWADQKVWRGFCGFHHQTKVKLLAGQAFHLPSTNHRPTLDLYCEMFLINFALLSLSLSFLFHFISFHVLFLTDCSTHSFVQEFVASPMDGASLLLEVLRAVQLSQNTITGSSTINSQNMELRNNQSYQRRALLDELTCLWVWT